ncbi:MAG: hypothetical protein LUI02_06700 [Clostridiales bacterium]|nr:hypothetical protein [Clostridiales bacterium]
MRYIVGKRYKKLCIQGEINLPRLTTVDTVTYDKGAEVLVDGEKRICLTTSSDAHEYFARDDDGRGLDRYALTRAIISVLATDDKDHQARWDRLWAREDYFGRFRKRDLGDHWIWNHDFYNASIEDLEEILNTVKGV